MLLRKSMHKLREDQIDFSFRHSLPPPVNNTGWPLARTEMAVCLKTTLTFRATSDGLHSFHSALKTHASFFVVACGSLSHPQQGSDGRGLVE